ncbi:MAG: hypothetical protein ACXW3U_11775, partial [Rhodoplanes sp.]
AHPKSTQALRVLRQKSFALAYSSLLFPSVLASRFQPCSGVAPLFTTTDRTPVSPENRAQSALMESDKQSIERQYRRSPGRCPLTIM